MRRDSKNIPYIRAFDRFKKPVDRLIIALDYLQSRALSQKDENNGLQEKDLYEDMDKKVSDCLELVSIFINEGLVCPNLVCIPERKLTIEDRSVSRLYLLHKIVRTQNISLVKLCLAKGADPDVTTTHNSTPMHYAAWDQRVDIMSLLHSYGANLKVGLFCLSNYYEDDPYTPTPLDILKEESIEFDPQAHLASIAKLDKDKIMKAIDNIDNKPNRAKNKI